MATKRKKPGFAWRHERAIYTVAKFLGARSHFEVANRLCLTREALRRYI